MKFFIDFYLVEYKNYRYKIQIFNFKLNRQQWVENNHILLIKTNSIPYGKEDKPLDKVELYGKIKAILLNK